MRNTRCFPQFRITIKRCFNAINRMRNTRPSEKAFKIALSFNAINSMRNTRNSCTLPVQRTGFNAINSMRNTRNGLEPGTKPTLCFNAINSMRNTRYIGHYDQWSISFQRY